MTTDHTREALERVVLAHTQVSENPFITCLCGDRWMTITEHAKHVARHIAAHVAALVEGRDAEITAQRARADENARTVMSISAQRDEARAALAVERERIATAIESARDRIALAPESAAGMTRAARIARSSTDGGQ